MMTSDHISRNKTPGFCVGGWKVEPDRYLLSYGGKTVKLEPKVMEALIFLANRAGETVTREELENNVWAGTVVGYYSLTGTMLKLRKAFDDDPKTPKIIETLPKKGYRLLADVKPIPIEATDEIPGKTDDVSPHIIATDKKSKSVFFFILGLVFLALILIPLQELVWSKKEKNQNRISENLSIAVLPFDNEGSDEKNTYFSDGITNDLITDLTKVEGLLVISRDSTINYRGKTSDIKNIADSLDVRYILHGNVRREDQSVRINAFLIDSETDKQLWAERYDGEISNIFGLQDKITEKIVSALRIKLSTTEHKNLAYRYTQNIQAYEIYLKAREQTYLYSKQNNAHAQQLLKKAIELDPGFGAAYALLAWSTTYDYMNGWSKDPEKSLNQAFGFAEKALNLHDRLKIAYFAKGLVLREQKKYDKALVEAEKAITIDPNYANAHVLVATLLYYAGKPREGLERMKLAIRLNPHHPHNYPFHVGQAYFVLKQYDEAINAFNEGLQSRPRSQRLRLWLAAAYAQSGEIEDAQWEIEQILLLNPEFSYKKLIDIFPFKDPADLAHFLQGLQMAGLTTDESSDISATK